MVTRHVRWHWGGITDARGMARTEYGGYSIAVLGVVSIGPTGMR